MDNVVIIGGSGELVDIQERCEQVCVSAHFFQWSIERLVVFI